MRKLFFAAACAAALGLFAPVEASAQFPARRVLARTVQATTGTRTFQPMRNAAATVAGGIAETKSRIQAAAGRMFHPGGGLGSGTHEGVGFSTISPEDALARCCFSNSGMAIIDQSVVRGPNGWYATRIYSATPATARTQPTVTQAVYTQTVPSQLQPGVKVLPGQHVVFTSVGTAHVAERAVWRPSYAANAVTCSEPNCPK